MAASPPVSPALPLADLSAALERLTELHPKLIDLSLDRMYRLLAALGNPQRRLPPVIHVAGTNGKGSTVAFLRAFLEAAGQRVHVYTSPHLVRFNERIRLAGKVIGDADLLAVLQRVEEANAGLPITFFEATTAAAFLAFAETPADVVILETGLGGRLDATNVLPRPIVSMLTPIGFDHEQFLGSSLAAIASEKAHIAKTGVPLVSAQQPAEARAAIETVVAAQQAGGLWWEGEQFHWTLDEQAMTFSLGRLTLPLPPPALVGEHQGQNAALAMAALLVTGHTFPLTVWQDGLRRVSWPARLQRLTHGPLADALPPDWELWLDGAHNPHAAEMLARFLPQWQDCPLDVVMGMMGPKDADGFFQRVGRFFARLRTVPVEGELASKPASEVAAAARRAGLSDVAVCQTVQEAVGQYLSGEIPAGRRRVLICGSLYLAGAVLAENGGE